MFLALPYFMFYSISLFGQQIIVWKIFWFLGRVVFLLIFWLEGKRLGLNKKTVLIIFLLNLFLINFFERLFFLLANRYLHSGNRYNFLDAVNVFSTGTAGRVFLGTIIGVFAAIVIGVLISGERKKMFSYLDAGALALAAGTFFYRIGNFLNHSHIGKITDVPWGIYYNSQLRHDISLYEMFNLLLVFSLGWVLRKKLKTPGLIFTMVLGLSSLIRFFTDFLRNDDLMTANFHFQNGLTLNQIFYFLIFVTCAIIFSILFRKEQQPNKEGLKEVTPKS